MFFDNLIVMGRGFEPSKSLLEILKSVNCVTTHYSVHLDVAFCWKPI